MTTIGPIDDAPWSEHLSNLLPKRYQQGNAAAYVTVLWGLLSDVLDQINVDTKYMLHQKHPNSPDDALDTLGYSTGLERYAGESVDNHRERLNSKWTTWENFGSISGMTNELDEAGYNDTSIMLDLPGSANYPSTIDYRSQFAVLINLDEIKGAGTESTLLSNEQLETVRQLIKKTKPVQYICREIIVLYDPTESVLLFDDDSSYLDEDDVFPDPIVDAQRSGVSYTHQVTATMPSTLTVGNMIIVAFIRRNTETIVSWDFDRWTNIQDGFGVGPDYRSETWTHVVTQEDVDSGTFAGSVAAFTFTTPAIWCCLVIDCANTNGTIQKSTIATGTPTVNPNSITPAWGADLTTYMVITYAATDTTITASDPNYDVGSITTNTTAPGNGMTMSWGIRKRAGGLIEDPTGWTYAAGAPAAYTFAIRRRTDVIEWQDETAILASGFVRESHSP